MAEQLNTMLEREAAPIKAKFDNVNQGAVAVEMSRAVAETQGKIITARQFPRDMVRVYSEVEQLCSRHEIAEKAFYSYPRAGETVSDVTIRFAEELARVFGNLDYGIQELSQIDGKSEMRAYAWDMETNTVSSQTFTVQHTRDVRGKAVTLTSQRDIYENNANMGARRLRARILAILPNDLVEMAKAKCRETLAGKSDEPIIDRIKRMVVLFGKLGVTQEQIERKLKHPIAEMTADELVDFVAIYNSLKQGETKPREWFEAQAEANETTAVIKAAMEDSNNDNG